MNLVPTTPAQNPNAWCTWATQNFTVTEDQKERARPQFAGDQGGHAGRDNLNEAALFGKNGWAYDWEKIRSDLYFLIDDGWDFPYRCPNALKNSAVCELHPDRFPSFAGTPMEGIRKLNEALKAQGWRGLGLWVASQLPGEELHAPYYPTGRLRRYWKERLEWFRDAGIEYVKMDWGSHSMDPSFRRMITELGWEVAPDMMIEHIISHGPFNGIEVTPDGEVAGNGRFESEHEYLAKLNKILEFADFVRTYDVGVPMDNVSTIDRTAYFLTHAKTGCVINVEDTVYLAAGLGCAFAAMRSSKWTNLAADMVARHTRRCSEVERAVLWQRIAPVLPVGQDERTAISDTILADEWIFKPGTSWVTPLNKRICQKAPSSIARNTKLPEVCGSEIPFIVVSKHPNGALAVSALPRISPERGLFTPLADVTLSEDATGRKLGVFGKFASITLPCNASSVKVYAQDLLADEAENVTDAVHLENGRLTIPGDLVDRLCAVLGGESGNGAVFDIQAI